MNTILTDTSRSALTTAFENNIFSLFKLFNQWPQAEVYDTPELFWSITDIPFPLFNSVLSSGLPTGSIEQAIDSILAEYKARGVPCMWWTGPSTQPANLGKLLIERGFRESSNPGMAADLALLPESAALPKNLQIKRVESEAELEIWNRVVTGVFGIPENVVEAVYDLYRCLLFDSPLINYIGSINDEVVAASTLFPGGGVAGIYNVATMANARQKGVGTAMTIVPLLEARANGYRVGALEASESGFNVYRKLGFQEYCKVFHYIWMGEHS